MDCYSSKRRLQVSEFRSGQKTGSLPCFPCGNVFDDGSLFFHGNLFYRGSFLCGRFFNRDFFFSGGRFFHYNFFFSDGRFFRYNFFFSGGRFFRNNFFFNDGRFFRYNFFFSDGRFLRYNFFFSDGRFLRYNFFFSDGRFLRYNFFFNGRRFFRCNSFFNDRFLLRRSGGNGGVRNRDVFSDKSQTLGRIEESRNDLERFAEHRREGLIGRFEIGGASGIDFRLGKSGSDGVECLIDVENHILNGDDFRSERRKTFRQFSELFSDLDSLLI